MGDGTRILVLFNSSVFFQLLSHVSSLLIHLPLFYLFYFSGYGWFVCMDIYAPHVPAASEARRGHQVSLELESSGLQIELSSGGIASALTTEPSPQA